ncbi:hypothetical protein ACIQUM_36165 [Amycolatopsis azurea]|uniref:hypothetical protein n=1 Tax=Amycolatopsis azurea TaxID=36819 RepID=UPI00380EA75D
MASDDQQAVNGATGESTGSAARAPKMCAWPHQCDREPRRVPKTGRPGRYCEQPDPATGVPHNKDTAFAERAKLADGGTTRQHLSTVAGTSGRDRPRKRLDLDEKIAAVPDAIGAFQAQLGQVAADLIHAVREAGSLEAQKAYERDFEKEMRDVVHEHDEARRAAEESEKAMAERYDQLDGEHREAVEIAKEANARAKVSENEADELREEMRQLKEKAAADVEAAQKAASDTQEAMQQLKQDTVRKLADAEKAAAEKITEAQKKAAQTVKTAEDAATAAIAEAKADAEKVKTDAATTVAVADSARQAAIEDRNSAREELRDLRAAHRQELDDTRAQMRQDHKEVVDGLRADHKGTLDALHTAHSEAITRMTAVHRDELAAIAETLDAVRSRAASAEAELSRLKPELERLQQAAQSDSQPTDNPTTK